MSTDVTATITVETLPVLVHQNARVVTTGLLAQLYGTEDNNIQMNFARNQDRFESGKHFYRLEGDELKAFKNRPTTSGSVGKRTRNLILWTERGAARHAKMLDTDQAWEVFEKLEDAYFRVHVEPVTPISPPAIPYTVQPTDNLTAEEQTIIRNAFAEASERLPKEKQRSFLVQGWSKLKAHFNCSYREIPRAEFAEAMSLVGRHIASFQAEPKALPSQGDDARQMLIGTRFLGRVEANGRLSMSEIDPGAMVMTEQQIARFMGDTGALIKRETLIEIIAAAAQRLAKTQTP